MVDYSLREVAKAAKKMGDPELLEKCEQLLASRRTFVTLRDQEPFEAKYLGGGEFLFTSPSMSQPRKFTAFKRVTDTLRNSVDPRVGDFQGDTVNASYILAVLQVVLNPRDQD